MRARYGRLFQARRLHFPNFRMFGEKNAVQDGDIGSDEAPRRKPVVNNPNMDDNRESSDK